MAFEFCCFISYPHGQENLLVPYIKDFVVGLKKEIYALIHKPVFIDYEAMEGGDRLDPVISQGLCKSVCMILIYTPLYFDKEHLYCAQELKAMQDLEQQRLEFLTDKAKGLIIPIVLRGEDKFPEKLKKDRLYYNFTSIKFNELTTIREKYADEIEKIANFIFKRCEQLDKIEAELKHDCNVYCLPNSDIAKEFVESVLETPVVDVAVSFPGRS